MSVTDLNRCEILPTSPHICQIELCHVCEYFHHVCEYFHKVAKWFKVALTDHRTSHLLGSNPTLHRSNWKKVCPFTCQISVFYQGSLVSSIIHKLTIVKESWTNIPLPTYKLLLGFKFDKCQYDKFKAPPTSRHFVDVVVKQIARSVINLSDMKQ